MPTLEQPAAAAPRVVRHSERAHRPRQLPRPNAYVLAISLCVLLAAASLLLPSSPSYDPWAWLIWGRQVLHLDLQTFGGPTWKPLPVLFTTVFAPFGDGAPKLWLLVARAGGLIGIAMAAALAYRLVRVDDQPRRGGAAPAVLAGAAAATGVVMLYQYLNSVATGESEGLLLALVLLAVMRHLDGARRQALALGFAAALVRPETWPLFGLYAIYLWVFERDVRSLIVALLALIPALWFLPELWGSGSLLRGVRWAQYPRAGSAAFAHCPFCSELTAHGWPLLLPAFKVGVAFALGGVALTAIARRRLRPGQLATLALGLIGLVWIVEEAVLTQIGFTGSDRYLLAPEGALIVVGAVGWGVLARSVARRVFPAAVCLGVLGGFTLLMLLAPEPGPHLGGLVSTVRFDSRLEGQLRAAVRDAGGARRLLACGSIQTNSSESPLVAWTLQAPLRATEAARAAVVIDSGNAQVQRLDVAPPGGYRLLAAQPLVRIYSVCGSAARAGG